MKNLGSIVPDTQPSEFEIKEKKKNYTSTNHGGSGCFRTAEKTNAEHSGRKRVIPENKQRLKSQQREGTVREQIMRTRDKNICCTG